MKRLSWLPFTLAASLLVGCSDLPTKLPATSAGVGNAQLVLTTKVSDGGFSIAALISAYSKSSINHLQLKLFTLSGETETPANGPNGTPIVLDLTQSELESPVTISRLLPNTTYRIRAYAYKAAGTATADLISTGDANSYVDVTLTNDDQPTMSTLKVKLIDRAFSGTATSSGVAVTNGGYTGVGAETFGLGSNGTLSTRVAGTPLAQGVGGQGVVRVGNYVYQITGGIPGGWTNVVQRASLDANGILGNFEIVDGVTVNTARDMASFAVIGNYLYVIGGRVNTGSAVNTIERATINSDGTIGTFSTLADTTSTARHGAALYVSGTYVYLIGGGTNSGATATIERAAINSDGTLGAFSSVSGATLNATRAWPATAVIGGYLYLVGGINSVNLASLERAPINTDGTLGSFETVSAAMTVARNAPSAVVLGTYLYVLGGYGPTLQNTIERASINADGSLGSFAAVGGLTLSSTRYGHRGLLAGNHYYVFGGDNGATSGVTDVDRFTIAN